MLAVEFASSCAPQIKYPDVPFPVELAVQAAPDVSICTIATLVVAIALLGLPVKAILDQPEPTFVIATENNFPGKATLVL